MNRVPVIVRNPAFVEELEPDGDEIDPADLIQDPGDDDKEEKMDNLLKELESRNVEADELLKEMRDYISSLQEGTGSKQPTVVPDVDIWDTGKATEQEYRLYPDPTMEEIRDRLANQVWDLLQILQERVDQHTCDSKDIEFISGLQNILILNSRLSIMTKSVLKC